MYCRCEATCCHSLDFRISHKGAALKPSFELEQNDHGNQLCIFRDRSLIMGRGPTKCFGVVLTQELKVLSILKEERVKSFTLS